MTERESLIISSLLHDIGKFTHRSEKELRSEYNHNLRYYCPSKTGYTYLLYSGQFVKDVFKNKESLIENLVLSHHKPEAFIGEKKLPKIIQISDWLSSGERREREEDEEVKFKKEPLLSIFSQVKIDGIETDGIETKKLYNKITEIDGNLEKLMPCEKDKAYTDEHNFKNLWQKFQDEVKYLSYPSGFTKIFNQIYSLLEKYTIFIPSASVKDKPEISLFHHLKSTCAIATCLYDLNKTEDELDIIIEGLKNLFDRKYKIEDLPELNKKDFILLKGDISGIQDFIYSVTSEKALKGLRGRSFYLQLISEIIAYKIIDEFNLTKANIIYLGGGNFTILLPNIQNVIEKIENLTKEIDELIFNAHQGKLGTIISFVDFSYIDFILNFGKVFENLGKKLVINKRKKFKYIMNKDFFKPYPEKIEKELKGCDICGKEIEIEGKCELCKSFEDLADNIKKSKVIRIEKCGKKKIEKEVESWQEIFEGLGYKIDFSNGKGQKILINDVNFLQYNYDGFRFEAIYSPEGTLENIADKATGIEKWGALRMDVDNLGKIFSHGLEDLTISRYSMLSYSFSLFFSLGIRDIIEKNYKEKCLVVYSGGDDLFIIAPWSDLPEISKEIYNKFKEYVCEHPSITISGGIYIAPTGKFPVYQAAKEAGSAEEKAKNEGKNRICFLEETLKWDDEFVKIEEVKNDLVKLLSENGKPKVSRALLSILYSGYRERELQKKKMSVIRIWRLFYALKRFMERHRGLENEIEKIREKFITDFELKEKLNVAIRWAELLTREEK